MKLNITKHNRDRLSVFEVDEEELRENLLKYSIEKNRDNKRIENMTFKNYWVI